MEETSRFTTGKNGDGPTRIETPETGLSIAMSRGVGDYAEGGIVMDFYAVVDQAFDLLRSRGRVSYRALRRQFDLGDDDLDALKEELLYAHSDAVTEDGLGLAWTSPPRTTAKITEPENTSAQFAERRHLTVLFCDLVDSTPLAGRLDPEDFSEVVQIYQDTCEKVIARYDGHIGAFLGDGLLVYFGFPRAHEDDAHRAVRAGLGIVEAIAQLNTGLVDKRGLSLDVRLGCHTGLVVVGALGGDARREELALGETPNIAARLQGVAAPNTLVISAATHQLLGGLFACESLGTPTLKGVAQPLQLYRVLSESSARTRLEALGMGGLTPLVGREREVALLLDRWTQVLDGQGQVVLLSGEAGIGKSRLVRALTEIAAEGDAWLIPGQSSPYHQHSALYPVIDLLERIVLRFERQESPEQKLRKLEGFLVQNGRPLAETVPLFASLLSIPLTDDYASLDISPEQQKQRTLRALIDVVMQRAAQQPVLFVIEDLHWFDPTTLELLGLLVEELSTVRVMALFTYRPDFTPPWPARSGVTELTLSRLPPDEVLELVGHVTQGKQLPAEVVRQVVAKTDGVPLFVEELTKMVLESGLLREEEDRYALTSRLPPLAIPSTLHDSLMARLDRLSAVRGLAQLCATVGREFTYPLLKAVASWDDGPLKQGLQQLVTAEFLYQQGLPPQATYRFKHALIQDTAYESLLKSTRQRHHLRIAEVLESRFRETVATEPELLAHHYGEAGLTAKAVPYWQAAGQRALQRSANREAVAHVTRGLEVLGTMPETPERAQQELGLQIMLGAALGATQGQQAVGHVYTRACELARQGGSTPELFAALWGYWYARIAQGQMPPARELAADYLELARRQRDPLVLAAGHRMLANTAWWQGDLKEALDHSREGLAIYNPEQHRASLVSYGQDSGVCCGWIRALTKWVLGYPDQAVHSMDETLARARGLAHPFSEAQTLLFSAHLYQLLREPQAARARAEEALALCIEHGFEAYRTWCLLPRGWAEAQQGHAMEGIANIHEALDARHATGAKAVLPWFYTVLGEAYGRAGNVDDGLRAAEEALGWVQHNDEHLYAAEAYRQEQ